jgi:P-type E1-E2 ATPase
MIIRLIYTRISNTQHSMEISNLDIFGAISYLFAYFFILVVMLIPVSLSKAVDYMINYTMKCLVDENVICLSKAAPENMARINQLCIEKGGTLTTK